ARGHVHGRDARATSTGGTLRGTFTGGTPVPPTGGDARGHVHGRDARATSTGGTPVPREKRNGNQSGFAGDTRLSGLQRKGRAEGRWERIEMRRMSSRLSNSR